MNLFGCYKLFWFVKNKIFFSGYTYHYWWLNVFGFKTKYYFLGNMTRVCERTILKHFMLWSLVRSFIFSMKWIGNIRSWFLSYAKTNKIEIRGQKILWVFKITLLHNYLRYDIIYGIDWYLLLTNFLFL